MQTGHGVFDNALNEVGIGVVAGSSGSSRKGGDASGMDDVSDTKRIKFTI